MPWRAVTVTTTPTMIWGYNRKRRSGALFNNGAQAVFISQNQAAITAEGFPIPAGAGATLHREEGDQPELTLWAQVASGTADIRVQEGTPETRPEPLEVKVLPEGPP